MDSNECSIGTSACLFDCQSLKRQGTISRIGWLQLFFFIFFDGSVQMNHHDHDAELLDPINIRYIH